MRFRNRIILAIATTGFSAGVALTPVAFAEDSGKRGTMFQGTTRKDSMARDAMSKGSMGKDAMSKDAMGKDSMKKDEMTR